MAAAALARPSPLPPPPPRPPHPHFTPPPPQGAGGQRLGQGRHHRLAGGPPAGARRCTRALGRRKRGAASKACTPARCPAALPAELPSVPRMPCCRSSTTQPPRPQRPPRRRRLPRWPAPRSTCRRVAACFGGRWSCGRQDPLRPSSLCSLLAGHDAPLPCSRLATPLPTPPLPTSHRAVCGGCRGCRQGRAAARSGGEAQAPAAGAAAARRGGHGGELLWSGSMCGLFWFFDGLWFEADMEVRRMRMRRACFFGRGTEIAGQWRGRAADGGRELHRWCL